MHLHKKAGDNNECPSSTSSSIKWKDGQNLMKKTLMKPFNHKKKRNNTEYKSFFDWFTDNSDPVNDEIGELIKDDLWPNPLQYYLVPDIEAEPDEDEDDENDDNEEENFDEEDGEGEDDEDEHGKSEREEKAKIC